MSTRSNALRWIVFGLLVVPRRAWIRKALGFMALGALLAVVALVIAVSARWVVTIPGGRVLFLAM